MIVTFDNSKMHVITDKIAIISYLCGVQNSQVHNQHAIYRSYSTP